MKLLGLKIKYKLPLVIQSLAILSLSATGLTGYFVGQEQLRSEAVLKLTGQLQSRRTTLEQYLLSIEQDLRVVARTDTATSAVGAMASGYVNFGGEAEQKLQQQEEQAWHAEFPPKSVEERQRTVGATQHAIDKYVVKDREQDSDKSSASIVVSDCQIPSFCLQASNLGEVTCRSSGQQSTHCNPIFGCWVNCRIAQSCAVLEGVKTETSHELLCKAYATYAVPSLVQQW